jgi:hypothetical protein
MSNKQKDLRKQLRTVVEEILPSFTKDALFAELQKENKARLDLLEKVVRDTLRQIEDRAKDHQSLVLRELMKATSAAAIESKHE